MDNHIQEKSLEEWAAHLDLEPSDLRDIGALLGRPANLPELLLFSKSWSLRFYLSQSTYLQQAIPVEGKKIVFNGRHRFLQLDNDLYCSASVVANHPLLQLHRRHGAALLAASAHRKLMVKGVRPEMGVTGLRCGEVGRASAQKAILDSIEGTGDILNNLGIPTLGRTVQFDESFNQTPVLNHFSIGFTNQEKHWGKVLDPSSVTLLLLSNVDLSQKAFLGKKPEAILQFLPDPLHERNLQESLLELSELTELIDLFDIGPEGLATALLELVFHYQLGLDLSMDGLSDLELLDLLDMASLSGALVLIPEAAAKKVKAIAQNWEVPCTVMGQLSRDKKLRIASHSVTLVDVALADLDGSKRSQGLHENQRRPGFVDKANKFSYKRTSHSKDYIDITKRILQEASSIPNSWLWQQLDQSSKGNSPFAHSTQDIYAWRLNGSSRMLLLASGGNAGYLKADPYNGALIAITEGIRKLIISGGRPEAILLSLNMGAVTDQAVNWQLQNVLKGVNEVCRKFSLPVLEAELSFDNEQITRKGAKPILPTPLVTVLGTIPSNQAPLGGSFAAEGHLIYMIGTPQNDVNGSLYAKVIHSNPTTMAPAIDLDEEYHIQQHLGKIVRKGLLSSAQVIGEGGLMVALLRSALPNQYGFVIETDSNFRKDTYLFGEHQSRILISVQGEREDELINYLNAQNVPFTMLGEVEGDQLFIDEEDFGPLTEWEEYFFNKPF
ncbi:MAG TPA: AIR synthase-related protein [Saprospiraceae bacterium]|nr:AIR synthase-related protein [Saprospiraceae bacterium]